jgi:myo-inositol-1(or 4)-monophosphatase
MLQPSSDLEAMIEAARRAGSGLMRRFGQMTAQDIRTKTNPADLVSIADEEAESVVRSTLAAAQPSFGFLGEEGGETIGRDRARTWVVDPLDGTTNFLFGTPLWGINVALVAGGEVTAGVTFLPMLDELYVAERGKGAWLNGRPIRVSTRNRLVDSVLGCGIPFAGKPDHAQFARDMSLLTPHVAGIRRTGACSVDMAWVACGRWDAYWERATSAWDMASGVILIREAGGMASAVTGNAFDVRGGNVCATNGRIHALLIDRLNKAAHGEIEG